MTKTFCDRCEKEIKKVNFEIGIFNRKKQAKEEGWGISYFCQPCFSALESFLKTIKQKKSTKRKTEKPIITKEGKILMPNLGII